jgi:ABC-type dipeptide/oligopeptide/nickel transport system permease subunit
MRRPPLAFTIGAALVGAVTLSAAIGPLLDVHPPDRKDVTHGLGAFGEPRPPSAEFPLGTDGFGRCVAARLLAGGRTSLVIGAGAALLALVLGTATGLLAGLGGEWTDALLMRLTDLALAFPFPLAVVAAGAALGRTASHTGAVLALLGLFGWTQTARAVRARAAALQKEAFVEAARAIGVTPARLLLRHLLPQVVPLALTLGTLSTAGMILAEAGLSYLGVGAPPPAPSWGRMLREGQSLVETAPWLIAAPGLVLVATVLGFNLLGRGLERAVHAGARR